MIQELFDLKGRTALITGGGTGLGLQFAKTLGSAGASVVITGRREDVLQGACDTLGKDGIDASFHVMDVSSEESIEAVLAQVDATILINNAGTTGGGRLEEHSAEEWDRIMDTNLKGPWLVAKHFVQRHKQREGTATIVNVSSFLGSTVQRAIGAYNTSKAAVLHLTRQMAVEWVKYGVRVNALQPGYYSTDMAGDLLASEYGQAMIKGIPQRRSGEVEELSGAVLLLCSDASSYMTGSAIVVDGGLSIPRI